LSLFIAVHGAMNSDRSGASSAYNVTRLSWPRLKGRAPNCSPNGNDQLVRNEVVEVRCRPVRNFVYDKMHSWSWKDVWNDSYSYNARMLVERTSVPAEGSVVTLTHSKC